VVKHGLLTVGVAFIVEHQTTLLEKDGKPYCENCYDAKFGEQCAAGCGRGLGPQRVKALGGLWHPDCFRYSPNRSPAPPPPRTPNP
jgi:hypothetical protein